MPDEPYRVQITLNASAQQVYTALTDTHRLPAWFAEHAEVNLSAKRYDFWGRYTPEVPTRDQGQHPLTALEADARLAYTWALPDKPTAVSYHLIPRGGQTVLRVEQTQANAGHDIGFYNLEDFWFLSLENLRRHLAGKAVVRCDFSAPMTGDIHHSVEIDAPPAAVFDALINPAQLNRWIASSARVEPKPGGAYDLGWGAGVAAHRILELLPDEKLVVGWTEDNNQSTIITWTLAASGGKTRLTLVHSGFAPDQDTGGLQVGWLNFMSWVRSLVEFGAAWQPPVRPLTEAYRPYYPAAIWQQQAALSP